MTIGQTVCPYCSNHCTFVKDAIFFSCAKCNNSLIAISRPDPLAPPDFYPADLLDFQVNELIGQGGMGRVFKGIDKKTGSIVAIKFPSKELIYSEIEKERFSNEINTLKLLNNPYIVKFFTSGVVAGFPFFVMEYVSGKNLGVAIQMAKQRGSAFPFDVVLGWFNQFCQALQSLHLHGIIHRDLKPQNIIITENGGLKIVDLGISKNLSNDSKNTITSLGGAGTFDYMAPEQLLGINNDNKSDIYSGGILFYEVLTSYLPLGNVKKPSVINETVPSWFDDIVFGMMERDPNARPTILEIFKKLQDFTPVPPVLPNSTPPPGRSIFGVMYIDILFYINFFVPIVLFFIYSYISAKSEFWEVSNYALQYGNRYLDSNFLIVCYLFFIPLIFLGCSFGVIYFWIYLPLNEYFLGQLVLEYGKGTDNDNKKKSRKHPPFLIVMGFGLLFSGLQYFRHIDNEVSHYSLLGEDAWKRGKIDPAYHWYKAAVDKNPNYSIGYLGLARVHHQKFEFTEALMYASKAIELNPKITEAFYIRGNVRYSEQKYAEAIADYTKAIELNSIDPKFALVYNFRGLSFINLKKYPEAITDFTKAIELNPKYVFAYFNRGVAYDGLKKYPEAIADYTKAIELNPKYADAYLNRGLAYKTLGKTKEAEADFAKAKELEK